MGVKAIMIDARDNVATLIADASAKDTVTVTLDGKKKMTVKAVQKIPFGHKIAIAPIKKGETVFKYGTSIGSASKNIKAGEHVHVHNIESNRGRGDLAAKAKK